MADNYSVCLDANNATEEIVTIELGRLGRGKSQSKNEFFVDHNGGRSASGQSKGPTRTRDCKKVPIICEPNRGLLTEEVFVYSRMFSAESEILPLTRGLGSTHNRGKIAVIQI